MTNLLRVWIGYYDRRRFRPTHWSQNQQLIQAAMEICEPVKLAEAQRIAEGFNGSEIRALASIDEDDLSPRMWAFVVDAAQEIKSRVMYRLVCSTEPTIRFAPSLN